MTTRTVMAPRAARAGLVKQWKEQRLSPVPVEAVRVEWKRESHATRYGAAAQEREDQEQGQPQRAVS